MSAPRFVRLLAVLAAVCTALVAAFPAWGVANAAESSHVVTTLGDKHEHGRGEHGDKHEKHGKDKPAATCTITVPANPLTGAGLATPYVLNDGDVACSMANPDTAAFVEAAITDGAGNVSIYRPLVITHGTDPAAVPTPVTVPAGSTVAIWFGFQGDTLKLVGPGAGACVNGQGNSLFGQFAYCNAPAFFAAAGNVTPPPLGTAPDGKPCPTVRDFFVVDQDQSDNVSTVYRLTADGRTAQDTAANVGLGGTLVNASDNGLLDRKIDPALGCAPFKSADLTNPGGAPVPALPLNEISAKQQATPIALIPLNDPMAKRGDMQNLGKVNLYRQGVGQPPATMQNANGTAYCNNLKATFPTRAEALKAQLTASTSPDPNMNLFDFMQDRFAASLVALGCG
jgi:hypothetical protein